MFAMAALVGASYLEEKVTAGAQVAGKAVGDFMIAVEEGVDTFKESVKAVAEETFGNNGRNRGVVSAIAARQEARWFGLSGRAAVTLTPEKRAELKKLQEVKKEIMERISILDEEIENLRGSIFHALYNNKIAIKRIKKDELGIIHKSSSWQELQEKVAEAITKEKVVVGRHSRTLALLTKIKNIELEPAKTHLSTPAST